MKQKKLICEPVEECVQNPNLVDRIANSHTQKGAYNKKKQKKTRDKAIQYGGPHKPRWLLGGWVVSDNGTPLIWENPHETKQNSMKSRWGEAMRAGIRNDTNEKIKKKTTAP